ncbi:hypothetical protein HU200_002168 [Digitaria exilis]|uniref:No apical meristem-associated C-terminal domain-containing protein n=1 Tax=Digitaria exilis TaxID=1010633 RepID=A0A835FXC8_9POAL|nr:hypothetical protein HU200_002168 [Digitaria exilis]
MCTDCRIYPPRGFSNYLQSDTFANLPDGTENSHFVGGGLSQSLFSPQYLGATRTPTQAKQTDHIVNDLNAEEDETINIDNDSRTDKRLNWTVPEDIRLASAWLHNSKDPVDGNGRKADAYGCWVNASRVWQSGMSDDQMIDKALEMWSGQNNGKAFNLLHMWKVVHGEQKWSAYLARLKKGNENSAKANPAQVANLDLDGEKRPMGHKRAKKELNGKKKSSDALAEFSEKFDKFIETSNKNREDREKMAEIQKSLADKIEAARLTHETAQEQTKCKMLETYTQLPLAPTIQLCEDALAERNLALENMRLTLFPKV